MARKLREIKDKARVLAFFSEAWAKRQSFPPCSLYQLLPLLKCYRSSVMEGRSVSTHRLGDTAHHGWEGEQQAAMW